MKWFVNNPVLGTIVVLTVVGIVIYLVKKYGTKSAPSNDNLPSNENQRTHTITNIGGTVHGIMMPSGGMGGAPDSGGMGAGSMAKNTGHIVGR